MHAHDIYEQLTGKELADLGVVLSAYRSFRGRRRKHIAYISTPITTGRRFYEVLSQNGVKTQEELEKKLSPLDFVELVIKPNIHDGIAFADRLGKREDLLFISPSVFEAKQWRWTTNAYMSLWYRVISEFAGSLIVMDDWEYSIGSVKEVLFSMFMQWAVIKMSNIDIAIKAFGLENFSPNLSHQEKLAELQDMRKIRVYDSSKNEISIDVALAKVVDVIYDLRERELPYEELFNLSWKLMQIPFFSGFLGILEQAPSEFPSQRYLDSCRRLYKFKGWDASGY